MVMMGVRYLTLRSLLSFLGIVFFCVFSASKVYALDVALVSTSGQAAYERFTQALLGSLDLAAIKFELHESKALDAAALARADVVLATGVQAAQAALDAGQKPVLAVMLSEESAEVLTARYPKAKWAAIVLDQPARRQLALFKALWPDKNSLGVLLGAQGTTLQADFEREARALGLSLKSGFLRGTRGSVPILQELMDGRDAILAPWDRDAFNAQNARVILLTTYRAGVPVLAYSAAAVEAGALAAVFSTPEDIARQVAEWLLQQKTKEIHLPVQRAPLYFDVALNPQVARSLKQDMPDRSMVLQRMREVSP